MPDKTEKIKVTKIIKQNGSNSLKPEVVKVTKLMIKDLKQLILDKEQSVLHLRKHGMKDTIIELIKARVK